MSAPAWTPGPWVARKGAYAGWEFTGGFLGRITAENGREIYAGVSCFHALRGATEEEADANARLIAAAPDLAEAVDAYLAAVDAKRQFEAEHPNDATKAWDDLLYAVEAAETALRAALAKAHGQ